MERVRLGSSAIKAVTYDEMQRTLDVELRGGDKYRYLRVPLPLYRALLRAESAGAFWNQVKGNFDFVKVD